MKVMYKNTVLTSQRTQCATIKNQLANAVKEKIFVSKIRRNKLIYSTSKMQTLLFSVVVYIAAIRS